LILRRALLIVKQVQQIITDNKTNINATMDIVPSLMKNVDTITDEVAHDVNAFRNTIDNIASTTESVTNTIKSNNGIVDGLSSIMHSAAITKTLYDKYFHSKIKPVKDVFTDVQKNTSAENL
jgi:ABC-type transporter Mla subunit MlaD